MKQKVSDCVLLSNFMSYWDVGQQNYICYYSGSLLFNVNDLKAQLGKYLKTKIEVFPSAG